MKDVLDKKVIVADILAIGIAALALQFLQAEKRNQIYVTGLT